MLLNIVVEHSQVVSFSVWPSFVHQSLISLYVYAFPSWGSTRFSAFLQPEEDHIEANVNVTLDETREARISADNIFAQ